MPSIKHPLLGRGLGRLFGILGRGVYIDAVYKTSPPFGRICNAPARSWGFAIPHALNGLQILTLRAVELQIRLNGLFLPSLNREG